MGLNDWRYISIELIDPVVNACEAVSGRSNPPQSHSRALVNTSQILNVKIVPGDGPMPLYRTHLAAKAPG